MNDCSPTLPLVRRPDGPPPKQGLYDPQFEHDACGVGFVVNIKGKASHDIIRQALNVNLNLRHRGACGCEANTGDGAGLLLQIPHRFFQQASADAGFSLPEPGHYGAGNIFLPADQSQRLECERQFNEIIEAEGQTVLGWRSVPTNNSSLGNTAKASEPVVRQVFIGRNPTLKSILEFERKLYIIRRRAENAIRYGDGAPLERFLYLQSVRPHAGL